MKKLLRGILEFRRNLTDDARRRFETLALGQKPDALFIACSDSRVVPNLFASTEPGDLFVMRNVGNLVAPLPAGSAGSDGAAPAAGDPSHPPISAVGAAVEYAGVVLQVQDIIVCGHSDCGAMRALLQTVGGPALPQVQSWLALAAPALARQSAGERLDPALSPQNNLAQLNVLVQLEHLLTYPFVRERVHAGHLRLHGWYFDIGRAEVRVYDADRTGFVPLDADEVDRILARA
ncbi:MAG: carbonic anhydrase [Planctomycetota bacterium]